MLKVDEGLDATGISRPTGATGGASRSVTSDHEQRSSQTSFLFGANAPFIEELYAALPRATRNAVDRRAGATFFEALGDERGDVLREVARRQLGAATARASSAPSMPRRCRARQPRRQGQRRRRARRRSPAGPMRAVRAAARIRARLMLIRSYRVRGHLEADLDPLGLEAPQPHPRARSRDLRLHRGRLRPADLHRQRAGPARRRPCARSSSACARPIAARSASSTCTSRIPTRRPGSRSASRRIENRTDFTVEGKRRSSSALIEAEVLRALPRHEVHRHQALRPRRRRIADPGARADHQARRPARHQRGRHRHAASRPAQRARQRHGQAATRRSSRSSRAAPSQSRGRAGLGRRQIPSRHLGRPRVRRQHRPSVADRQPLAPRGGQPGRARQGARQAGPARRQRAQPGDGAS